MNLNNFKSKKDWVKVWSGRWGLNFDSHVGDYWARSLKVAGKPIFNHVVYFYNKGITDCWVSQSEKDFLGSRLCVKSRKNPKFISNLCNQLKLMADEITLYLGSHNPQKLSFVNLGVYWNLIRRHYLPMIGVKYIVDYLSPKELKRYLSVLEGARLYAESTFRNTENFFEKFIQEIAYQNHYPKNILLSTTGKEIESYFKNGKLLDKKILKQRFAQSALIIEKGQQKLFVGKDVKLVEKIVSAGAFGGFLKGQIAYKGRVVGQARVVLNPKSYNSIFNKGDILITGMTRPEFLPLMKKAGGFVTDAGGILSHAAIMARELKKPCSIGTKVATKVFKDGDKLEIDANKGVVKKIY